MFCSKKLRLDSLIIHASLVFIFLNVIFSIWVHHSFQGNYWGPFLPGAQFGIPQKEAEMGMYPTSPTGWDAQFYYYESSDLLALGDAKDHIDNPPYRYQRIGMPMIAGITAKILGYETTPAWLYHLLQILIVSVGFYVLISWLRENHLSTFYAYGWLLSIGVINALAYGMPDPVGDALFIISIIYAIRGRLVPFAVVTSLLLLVREGYAIYAAIVFLITLFGKIPWKHFSKKLQVLYTMLPGVVVLVWMGYVTWRFGKTPIEAGQGSNLTDWPFFAAGKEFLHAIQNSSVAEVIWKQTAVLLIFISLFLCWKNSKKLPILYAVIGYILLTACLGTTIWFDYSGYMKSMGSIIAVIVILLPFEKNFLLKLFIILLAVAGMYNNFQIKKDAMYSKHEMVTTAQFDQSENNEPLKDFSTTIKLIEMPKQLGNYHGIFRAFHRSVEKFKISITNTTHQAWYPLPLDGKNSINASYHWYDSSGKKLLYDGIRNPILQKINPGQNIEMEIKVMIPPPGDYILRITMLQEGVAWFYQAGGGYLDLELHVN